MYRQVAGKSEDLLQRAWELGKKHRDTVALSEELYTLAVQPFFADGAESLAIAAAMIAAAEGDYRKAVTGAVNFGRDNDSSAAVAGAVTGALGGIEAVDRQWVETVEGANPEPSLSALAEELAAVVSAGIENRLKHAGAMEVLLQSAL